MCKRLIYFISFILVLGLVSGTANADPYQQDAGPDGIVSMEAENFDENVPNPPHTWILVTEPEGFSGAGAMQSTPTDPGGGAGNDTGYVENSPRLDFEVNFAKAGIHYIWIRGYGQDGNSDSCHAGINGEDVQSAYRFWSFTTSYTWLNVTDSDPPRRYIEVPSAGVHTVNVWMREDACIVDKIVLTTNPDYTPTDEGPEESHRGPRLKAYKPSPKDNELYTDTWVNLSWSAADTAISHDVYFGENFDHVNDGTGDTFQVNQAGTFYIVGFPGYLYPEGLVPGTTYYWRVDEVEADGVTKHKGDVWSFWIPPYNAYNPAPADGTKFVDSDTSLSWTDGFSAKLHYIYFGDNFDDVNNATVGMPLGNTSYTPVTLELDKTYYWRVDEFDGAATHKGEIWSFSTIPEIAIADPSLKGWWTLDEGIGTTAVDWSGHGNHGTFVGDPLWVPGYDGYALEFDGGAYVDTGYTEDLANWTITAWVISPAAPSSASPSGPVHREQNYQFNWNHSNEVFRGAAAVNVGGTWYAAKYEPLQANRWYHLAASYDGSSFKAYRDGVLITTNSTPSGPPNAESNSLKFGRHAAAAQYFTGTVDIVRVYDKALTDEEILLTMRGDPLLAWAPIPFNGTMTNIKNALPLSWSPGDNASQHDVYFGTDKEAVANADQTNTTGIYRVQQGATSYNPTEGVEWGGGPYYWRIDEVSADGTVSKGNLWSFTVADFFVIDDFESYNDLNEDEAGSNRIYLAWIDGFDNPAINGSTVGHLDPPFAEQTIVHSGGQSMPFAYDNAVGKSEATLTLTDTRDWTEEGVGVLSIWFQGDASNAAEPMYVVLNGTAAVTNDNPDVALISTWAEWRIDLQAFADQGVSLSNVNTITLGFGNRINPVAGGSGMMFFDDIRLYRPAP